MVCIKRVYESPEVYRDMEVAAALGAENKVRHGCRSSSQEQLWTETSHGKQPQAFATGIPPMKSADTVRQAHLIPRIEEE